MLPSMKRARFRIFRRVSETEATMLILIATSNWKSTDATQSRRVSAPRGGFCFRLPPPFPSPPSMICL
eukprot:12620950-Heterocapsa_arctica.AAC.1